MLRLLRVLVALSLFMFVPALAGACGGSGGDSGQRVYLERALDIFFTLDKDTAVADEAADIGDALSEAAESWERLTPPPSAGFRTQGYR